MKILRWALFAACMVLAYFFALVVHDPVGFIACLLLAGMVIS